MTRPTHPLHLLVQSESHADKAMQGGVGVDEGVEGLVAFAVALGLPGADGSVALEASDEVFFVPLTRSGHSGHPQPMSAWGRK